MSLKAVVIGAGWAGEGHTLALHDSNVDVVAICGRSREPTCAAAERLGIPNARVDWRSALTEFSPDIVAIATPAGPHPEMAIACAQAGCHTVCEKPLAVDAAKARAMLEAVENAGVKHAYASTSRYGPCFIHARSLVADGLIGDIVQIEHSCHAGLSRTLPYSWMHRLSDGGGLVNNMLPHLLGQVRQITTGEVIAAAGQARQIIDQAPIGPPIHDFRQSFLVALNPSETKHNEWGAVDADMAFTVLAQLLLPNGRTADALIHSSAFAAHPENYLALHGTEGSLFLSGAFWAEERIRLRKGEWQDLEIPSQIMAALPSVPDRVQRDWNQLYREFTASLRDAGPIHYPTFREGYLDAAVAEVVRQGANWTSIQ